MIKAIEKTFEKFEGEKKLVRASLVADTKEEVQNITEDTKISGIADNEIMTLGSSCMTVNGDYGMLGSDGHWTF